MLHLLLAAAALGLAGFDPLGLVALIAAMALRVKRSGVAILMASTLLSTMLFGIIPALTLGPAVGRLHHAMRHVSHLVWGPLVVAIGLGLLGWGVLRLVRRNREHTSGETARITSVRPAALAFSGFLVGLSAFIDPAFYAMVAFAAHERDALRTVAIVVVWVLFSQSALVVVGLATLLGLYEPVHRMIEAVKTRWSRPLGLAASVALVLVGLFCLVQGVAEWHGHWLPLPFVPHGHRPR